MNSWSREPEEEQVGWELFHAACSEQAAIPLAELEAYLREHPDRQALYCDYCQLHVDLQIAFRSRRAQVAGMATVQSLIDSSASIAPPTRRGLRSPLAVAALTTLLTAYFWFVFFGLAPIAPRDAGWEAAQEAAPRPKSDARLTHVVEVRWRNGAAARSAGAFLSAGNRLQLEAGLAEVTFADGAMVLLEGPADFRIASPASGTLVRGALTARVGESARGFKVATPSTTIVDLGTEFGVEVDSAGQTFVQVFSGAVEAAGTLTPPLQLAANESALIASDGQFLASTLHTKAFVRRLPARVPSPYEAAVLASGPWAYLQFDEAGRKVVLRNRSPRSGSALVHGVLAPETARLGLGAAAGFDGRSYVTIEAPRLESPALSVEAWVRSPGTPKTFERIAEQAWERDGFVFTLNSAMAAKFQLTPGHVSFGQNVTFAESRQSIADDRWHHVVGVWDGQRLLVYLDGEAGASVPLAGGLRVAPEAVFIGADQSGGEGWRGALDEVAFYDRALTPDEVQAHFRAANPPADPRVPANEALHESEL